MGSLGVSKFRMGCRGFCVVCLSVSVPIFTRLFGTLTTSNRIIVLISLLPMKLGNRPYNFSISQLGLTYIAQLIGNLVGCYSCGYLNDVLSQWSARRNDGVFEPEMRFPVIVIPATLGPAGILMFGIGVVKEVHWIVPVIGHAFLGVALTGLPSIVQPYLMDSYYPVRIDALIVSHKNLLGLIMR